MLNGPTGATRVAAVIGDPVEHSLSPVLHNAAFKAMDLDWVYVAFRVAAGSAAEAIAAMRALRLAGLSVTMPHKAGVAEAVDRLGPVAARLGVANTVFWSGSELVGESTDGAGFIAALRSDSGFSPHGKRCVVLGAGGAARAVTLALAEAGASAVTVVARREEQADACAGVAGVGATSAGLPGLARSVGNSDLIVNATPVGMAAGAGLPFGVDEAWLRPGQFVTDLIYAPETTPLLAAARRAGAGVSNGLGMLVHQAALQLQLWTGRPAPIDDMTAAVQAVLGSRGGKGGPRP